MAKDIREIYKIEPGMTEDDFNHVFNNVLGERSVEIDVRTENDLMRETVNALKQTLKANNLTSLSAPAIGIGKRIFVINFKEEIKTFINPVIVAAKGIQLSTETCSSLPGKKFIVPRNNDIMVVYQRPMGKIEQRQMIGQAAFVFQHEMQHLDGMLISDIGLEIDDDFENAPEEDKNEIINAYLDSLDIRTKELDQEVQEDPELKQMSDAIDFMTSVYKGETKLECNET